MARKTKVVTVAVTCPKCGDNWKVLVSKRTLKPAEPAETVLDVDVQPIKQGEIGFDNKNWRPKR